MTRARGLIVSVCICVVISGCSTRPRQFAATLSAPAADVQTYQDNLATCRTLVGRGYKSNFKSNAAVVLAGTAAGTVSVGFAATAALNATLSNLFSSTATSTAATSLSVAAPFVGFAVGFGMSRAIRSGREKKVKRAMAGCLGEYGYSVASWTPIKKQKKGVSALATTASVIPPVPPNSLPAAALQSQPVAQSLGPPESPETPR